jgi:tetratricopeptide (TPR) repeat protein
VTRPRRGVRATAAVAAAAAAAGLLAVLAAPVPGVRAQGLDDRRTRTILIGGSLGSDGGEPSLLPLADEQLVERARTLLRAGQPGSAERIVQELEARHPEDLDVLLARAELLQRTAPPPATARFLDERAKRPAVARALRARPYRAGFWARFASDSYAAAGMNPEAMARALEAWERSPEQGAWARVRLEQWSGGRLETLARDYARLADRHPRRVDLVLESARAEALAGRIRPAVERVRRAEARPDSGVVPGALLWQLALSLRSRGDLAERAADSALVALARDEAHDPGLRERAVNRLFEDRLQAELVPSGGEWVEGSIAFLRPPAEVRPGEAPPPAPVDPEVAARNRLLALEAVWRGLPAGPDQVRRGLDLAERLEAAGEEVAARQVARDAAALAGRVPGAEGDPEVGGRLALEKGEAALLAGDLDGAVRTFDAVAASGASERLREEAAFQACEARFFAGRFDSAAAGYDAFARAFPGSPHANDALERVYLIEGAGAPPPGLAEFAAASLSARAGRIDEAKAKAEAAEQRAAGGPAWSHAGLLVAALLETQGKLAEAAARARAVAETAPDDRLAPTARRRAGDLLLAAGDAPGALGQYEELLVRYPRSWLAPETRRRVQELRRTQGGTP